jgi:hypothetical protein
LWAHKATWVHRGMLGYLSICTKINSYVCKTMRRWPASNLAVNHAHRSWTSSAQSGDKSKIKESSCVQTIMLVIMKQECWFTSICPPATDVFRLCHDPGQGMQRTGCRGFGTNLFPLRLTFCTLYLFCAHGFPLAKNIEEG